MRIFADSFHYIALLNPSDRFHRPAIQFARDPAIRIITTTWALVEVADALNVPAFRRPVHRFLEQIAVRSNTRVIPVDAARYARGLALYGARADKAWSPTGCISFEATREYRLMDALTGDHHFEQAGFRALLRPA